MVPEDVAHYLESNGLGRPVRAEPVGGGCINDGRVLTTSSGARCFLKTNTAAPADMFEREAEGLAALAAVPGGPRVPQAFLAGPDFLLLEHLAPAPSAPNYWPVLGRQLARLHAHTADQFGFDHANYLGLTPQPNPRESDGYRFFAEHRLAYLGRLCRQRDMLDQRAESRLNRLITRLPDLIPPQPASLLHGDLWSGNIIPGPAGLACLIDPAAHYNWAEADLAMTTLFGSPPPSFFEAYEELRPLSPGYTQRFEIYKVYHLLNHLCLFGGGYGSAVEAVLQRYG
jgi:fructosamine-3-kinase